MLAELTWPRTRSIGVLGRSRGPAPSCDSGDDTSWDRRFDLTEEAWRRVSPVGRVKSSWAAEWRLLKSQLFVGSLAFAPSALLVTLARPAR